MKSLRLSLTVSSIFRTVGRGEITTKLTTCGGNKFNMMAITRDDVKENIDSFDVKWVASLALLLVCL